MSFFRKKDPQWLRQILQAIPLPQVPGLTLADALTDVRDSGGRIAITFAPGYPGRRWQELLEQQVKDALAPSHTQVEIAWEWGVAQVQPLNNQTHIPGVRNIVAIASGKGGVGKSTTTVNLALALAAEGARVGILDADIYGPSQAHMLGVATERPAMLAPNLMQPIPCANEIQLMSMGNLVTETTPMVWRGPMVSGALQQLLKNTRWDTVDYLFVDMPPGTGDIQLTLSQSVPVSGSVIVTTPQDIALLDARKGIEMFRKVNIPVLGIVENMATHVCTQCGHQDAIFGEGGGAALAHDYAVDVLGRLPLQRDIREQTDRGVPPVVSDPGSAVSLIYRDMAVSIAGRLWALSLGGEQSPQITMSDD